MGVSFFDKDRKSIKLMLLLAVPIILLAAYADVRLLGIHSFWNYVFICVWEYFLFMTGLIIGLSTKKKDYDKLRRLIDYHFKVDCLACVNHKVPCDDEYCEVRRSYLEMDKELKKISGDKS